LSPADFVNPKDLGDKSIVDYLVEETDGGLDFTFDATGNVSCHRFDLSIQLTGFVGPSYAIRSGGLSQGLGCL
jgi:Zn-dependent alcohol dehydrogenase